MRPRPRLRSLQCVHSAASAEPPLLFADPAARPLERECRNPRARIGARRGV